MTTEWNWTRTPDGGWYSGPPKGNGTYVLPEMQLAPGYTPPSASMNADAAVTSPASWQCPVVGHHSRADHKGRPLPTVEWDGKVMTCLATGCGRRSDDPIPRRECMCEGCSDSWGTECTGECCGVGQCTCTPAVGALPYCPDHAHACPGVSGHRPLEGEIR